MKNVIKLIAATLCVATLGSCSEPIKSTEQSYSDGLRFNESTLPYDGGILIANFGTEEFAPLNAEGKGYIAYLKDGAISTFIPAGGYLSAPKGMVVQSNYLLVCDVNRVVAFDLNDLSAAPQTLSLPEGEFFANDLASDGTNIYLTVTNSGNIYKFCAENLAQFADTDVSEPWFNVVGANGIVYSDATLYVASYPADGVIIPENVIYKISDLESPKLTAITSEAGRWDGLAISEDKKTLYTSSWNPLEIASIDIASGEITPLDVETPFDGPADITLHKGVLYIPDMPNSTVIVKEL